MMVLAERGVALPLLYAPLSGDVSSDNAMSKYLTVVKPQVVCDFLILS